MDYTRKFCKIKDPAVFGRVSGPMLLTLFFLREAITRDPISLEDTLDLRVECGVNYPQQEQWSYLNLHEFTCIPQKL